MSIPVLTLRPEFRGAALKGTAIELATKNKTGATQIPAADFLNITYPSYDLVKALQAIGPHQDRPVVLIGERGIGKSHLMAALHHAGTDAIATQAWLAHWATTLNRPDLATIALRQSMKVISEKLTSNAYKFLWDLLFDNHPKGEFIRGKWQAEGKRQTNVPSEVFGSTPWSPFPLTVEVTPRRRLPGRPRPTSPALSRLSAAADCASTSAIIRTRTQSLGRLKYSTDCRNQLRSYA